MSQALVDLPHFLQERYQPGKGAAWALAVAMHVLLAMFLIYGIRWQTTAPESVSVDLVSYRPASVQQDKLIAPTPQEVQEDPPPSPPKAEILRKAPEKPKTMTDRVAAISKMLQRETDRMMNSRIADAANREQEQIKAGQAMTAKATARATWFNKIAAKIKGNLVRPTNVPGSPEAIYEITVLPDGSMVGEPRMIQTTGNKALDDAIVRAILKSSPLPKPDDQSAYDRIVPIKLRPMED